MRSRKSCHALFKVLCTVEMDKPCVRTEMYLNSCSGWPGHRAAFSFVAGRYQHSME